ncbi:MAG: hypothetical protein B6D36_00320 [Planctomycetes bacterium UTPLA1]|jgi:hypothetical protein|nr:MAG: hypothetical protein B6D36_00320 [Planctomycetes bacterium UTPLA1]
MALKISPEIISKRRSLGASWGPREGGHDRVNVLVKAVDLQELSREILIEFFRARHSMSPHQDIDKALVDILPDDASLKKSARLLFLAGLIDLSVRDDLIKIDKIRDMYAHKKMVGQIDATPDLQKILADMEMRKQNNADLASLPTDRHRFYAIVDTIENHLKQILKAQAGTP